MGGRGRLILYTGSPEASRFKRISTLLVGKVEHSAQSGLCVTDIKAPQTTTENKTIIDTKLTG